MMAVKTAYRPKKPAENNKSPAEESAAVNIPMAEINGEEIQPVAALNAEIPTEPAPDLEAIAKAANEAATADEAALALRKQIEAIRQSEEIQRRQQIAQNVPTTREGKLALWESQGATAAELKFLEANGEMIDLPQLTARAAAQATQQGHERGTEGHMQATKNIFYEHFAKMQQEQTPEFFRPPPQKAPAQRSAATIVSAPVSRETPGNRERYRSENPDSVTLSPEEIEHAQVSGVSLRTYAENKLRLEREKRAGLRQNG